MLYSQHFIEVVICIILTLGTGKRLLFILLFTIIVIHDDVYGVGYNGLLWIEDLIVTNVLGFDEDLRNVTLSLIHI